MTTIIEQPTDSGNTAVGLILGILLAIALVAGGLYFYGGGVTHTETNNTTILPAPSAPAPAPQVNISTPAPAAPAAPADSQ